MLRSNVDLMLSFKRRIALKKLADIQTQKIERTLSFSDDAQARACAKGVHPVEKGARTCPFCNERLV